MTSTQYVDANLHHDLMTAKAVTAILHVLNATQVHWHCKRQLTLEPATFGSEFVAARTAVDLIIDICLTLMYLGVPINPKNLSTDLQSVCCWPLCDPCSDLPVAFWFFI